MKQVESSYLFDFSKFLFDEHGLIVTDTEMQEIIHQAKKVDPVPVERTAEEVEALAVEATPLTPVYADLLDNLQWEHYIKHLRMKWVEGYNAAASTVPKTAGVWVKASEKMPKKPSNARYNDKPGILIPTTGGCMFQGFNEGWGYSENEPGLFYVEWLDESSPTSGEGK